MNKKSRVDELISIKVRKLGQQKALSDQLNDILTRQGGLNDQALQTCKNLEHAIAVAKRPGAIEYFQQSEETRRIVENGNLAALTLKMSQIQRELDQVDYDIQRGQLLPPQLLAEPSLTSLKQWFETYGKPKPTPPGFLTNFEESPKIYGGTSHHR
ncbi:unnamed protein product, partial [Choristocarpus tenellus]